MKLKVGGVYYVLDKDLKGNPAIKETWFIHDCVETVNTHTVYLAFMIQNGDRVWREFDGTGLQRPIAGNRPLRQLVEELPKPKIMRTHSVKFGVFTNPERKKLGLGTVVVQLVANMGAWDKNGWTCVSEGVHTYTVEEDA